jgi:hypothetical protein
MCRIAIPTACSFSAATQFGSDHPILDQPYIDFVAAYQVGNNNHGHQPTVTINDNIAYDGAVVSWIENAAGDRPFGNDLDPTLNLDLLEVAFRNHERWQIIEDPRRLETLRRILRFQRRLTETGAFADPRSHIYYLPELYCAYFGRCYAAFKAMPPQSRRRSTRRQFRGDSTARPGLCPRRLDGHRDEPVRRRVGVAGPGEARGRAAGVRAGAGLRPARLRRRPLARAFQGLRMEQDEDTDRILVGGPEVTSAFVLSALVHARAALRQAGLWAMS